ncbi:MAG TPA: FHA domain-containing protein [Gemmataceae bacterium]|jgi:pSer/pThr/pTyr-binding forkhead associated (FHA) protein|nr:FHA domain-containing protein [Gemmataceae bacterium]
MPAQLLSLSEGPSILLDKPIMLVGRHEECDLQLNSRKVSRKHCCIAQAKDHLVIRDLGSTNGIRINGTRVQGGILRTGDELMIGNFRYQVSTDGPRDVIAAAPAVPASPLPVRPTLQVDDSLESVDVPVPLPERGGARPPVARIPPGVGTDSSGASARKPGAPPGSSSFFAPS